MLPSYSFGGRVHYVFLSSDLLLLLLHLQLPYSTSSAMSLFHSPWRRDFMIYSFCPCIRFSFCLLFLFFFCIFQIYIYITDALRTYKPPPCNFVLANISDNLYFTGSPNALRTFLPLFYFIFSSFFLLATGAGLAFLHHIQ